MQIDQNMLKKLLTMNDAQLRGVIEAVAAEAGIDPAVLGLDTKNIGNVRRSLGSAQDSDLEQINTLYNTYKQNKHGR